MTDAYTPHTFCPIVAEKYGIPAALILHYIQFRSACVSGWVDITLPHFCKQYPYLGRKQVWSALQKLIHPGRKTPPLVFRKQENGAYLYSPASKVKFHEMHIFDPRIAKEHGLIEAIIFHNVSYWIKLNWYLKAQEVYKLINPGTLSDDDTKMQVFSYHCTRKTAYQRLTISKWLKHHAYVPKRTAERGFSRLLKAGLLRVEHHSRGEPWWFLTYQKMREYRRNMIFDNDLCSDTAKRKRTPPKRNEYRQNETDTAKTKQTPPKRNANHH